MYMAPSLDFNVRFKGMKRAVPSVYRVTVWKYVGDEVEKMLKLYIMSHHLKGIEEKMIDAEGNYSTGAQ